MKFAIGWFTIIVVCSFCACKPDKKQLGVLEQQQLAEILVEIYTGEARISNLSVVNDSAVKLFRPFEEALLKKKGIPDSILKTTFRYYVEHPVELEQVYDIVIDTLSLREQKAGLRLK
ncbi:MAG: DUF4296 domain-containing protein [Bacteroidia bacterium]|nr:DUF4296 domain-containing protein [Bacteroidia bacterium]